MSNQELCPQVDFELLDETYLALDAMRRVNSPVYPTNLYRDEVLSDKYNADVWFASELHQIIGAYKIRGAYWAVENLSDSEKELEVITASAGNHSQAIAYMCSQEKIRSRIYMPTTTPAYKVNRVAELGGEYANIELIGDTFDDAQAKAQEFSEYTGASYISPFNNPYVIAGQGTWGAEIVEQLPKIDIVFCPAGGTGLLAGTSTVIKSKSPSTEIIAVEPKGAASLKYAMKKGKPTRLKREIDIFIDGAAVQEVGDLPFHYAHNLINPNIRTVSKVDIKKTTTELWNRGIHAELAGSLSVAAVEKYKRSLLVGNTILCMITGGNMSEERFRREVEVA